MISCLPSAPITIPNEGFQGGRGRVKLRNKDCTIFGSVIEDVRGAGIDERKEGTEEEENIIVFAREETRRD